MSPPLLILTQVRAFDPHTGVNDVVDVVVENGIITRLGPNAASPELLRSQIAKVVQGENHTLLPAFVDVHTHLREPGQEYKEDIESGLKAAAAGGFAHVCAMPNTRPVNDCRSITDAMLARARSLNTSTLYPIGAITKGLKGTELTEMADMKEAGIVAVSDDGRCVMNSLVMRRAMEYARNFDLPVIQHAEDHHLTEGAQMNEGAVSTRLGLRGWPSAAEEIIVARDVLLAELTGVRYHVAHVSTKGAIRILREAKSRGIHVTAEVTPHHLTLTDLHVVGYNTACKVNPPLREERDVQAVREALADGTIDMIATDHAPHSVLEKDCEFGEASVGMIGLEIALPILLDLERSGHISRARLVHALTQAPAKLIGITSPSLKVGNKAEFCLIDEAYEYKITPETLCSKSHNTPFLHQTLHGKVLLTTANGRIVYNALFDRSASKSS